MKRDDLRRQINRAVIIKNNDKCTNKVLFTLSISILYIIYEAHKCYNNNKILYEMIVK